MMHGGMNSQRIGDRAGIHCRTVGDAAQVLDAVKGQAYEAFDRSIDVHVSNLRSKLERDPKAPRYIKTVRGTGYVLPRDAE